MSPMIVIGFIAVVLILIFVLFRQKEPMWNTLIPAALQEWSAQEHMLALECRTLNWARTHTVYEVIFYDPKRGQVLQAMVTAQGDNYRTEIQREDLPMKDSWRETISIYRDVLPVETIVTPEDPEVLRLAAERLDIIAENPELLMEADLNADGKISAEEWDLLRERVIHEVRAKLNQSSPQSPSVIENASPPEGW